MDAAGGLESFIATAEVSASVGISECLQSGEPGLLTGDSECEMVLVQRSFSGVSFIYGERVVVEKMKNWTVLTALSLLYSLQSIDARGPRRSALSP